MDPPKDEDIGDDNSSDSESIGGESGLPAAELDSEKMDDETSTSSSNSDAGKKDKSANCYSALKIGNSGGRGKADIIQKLGGTCRVL
eukprot:gene10966-12128_t